MRRIPLAILAAWLLTAWMGTANADVVGFGFRSFTFDDDPSFLSDSNSADYEVFFGLDQSSPPTLPVSNFRFEKDGIDIGDQGLISSSVFMTTAGGGVVLFDFEFDGTGSDINSAGTFSLLLESGDGTDIRDFTFETTTWEYSASGQDYTGYLTSIPEPASGGIVGIAILAGFFVRRRRIQ